MKNIDFPFDDFHFKSDSIFEGLSEADLLPILIKMEKFYFVKVDIQQVFITLNQEKLKNTKPIKKEKNKYFISAQKKKY